MIMPRYLLSVTEGPPLGAAILCQPLVSGGSSACWKRTRETGDCAKCRCIDQGNLSPVIIALWPLNAQWWQANKWLSLSALTLPEHSGSAQAVSRFGLSSVLLYDLWKETNQRKCLCWSGKELIHFALVSGKTRTLAPAYLAFGAFLVTQTVENLPAMQMSQVQSLGSPGEGNGNPLQYSCRKNPVDMGTWQATIHGVTEWLLFTLDLFLCWANHSPLNKWWFPLITPSIHLKCPISLFLSTWGMNNFLWS